jgi:hypothetical protein
MAVEHQPPVARALGGVRALRAVGGGGVVASRHRVRSSSAGQTESQRRDHRQRGAAGRCGWAARTRPGAALQGALSSPPVCFLGPYSLLGLSYGGAKGVDRSNSFEFVLVGEGGWMGCFTGALGGRVGGWRGVRVFLSWRRQITRIRRGSVALVQCGTVQYLREGEERKQN